MPRNSSGTMTLPAPGVPFQSGQVISSAQVNNTLTDLAGETTDSLSRSGKGAMLASLKIIDGTEAVPAVTFTAEPSSGLYRAGANDVRLAVDGVDALKLAPGGLGDTLVVPGGSGVKTAAANAQVFLQGNRAAADAGTDVGLASTATRTAGNLLAIQNPVLTDKLLVDFQGLLRLAAAAAAAAIQPASMWTAITPDTNIAGSGSPAYVKDATGRVQLKGGLTNNTGGAATTFVTTNPLPTGFRPASQRVLPGALSGIGAGSPVSIAVGPTGVISTLQNVPNSITLSLDAVSFMAEQ